jgi:hypothetical protein
VFDHTQAIDDELVYASFDAINRQFIKALKNLNPISKTNQAFQNRPEKKPVIAYQNDGSPYHACHILGWNRL